MTNSHLIALFGPTAVGKTDIALALGELLSTRGESPLAISADALQVYRGLEVLTAAPTSGQQRRLEHRLISFVPIDQSFSAGQYAPLAHAEIDSARDTGGRPIIVGGTGLYLRAALANLDLRSPVPAHVRHYWQHQLAQHGAIAIHRLLTERDYDLSQRIAPTDSHRLIRAHELLDVGAQPQINIDNSQLWTSKTRVPTLLVGLTCDRDISATRIDQRVDDMVADGVINEVRAAERAGASATARKALGYSQFLTANIDAVKTATRRYARRQLTWLKKLPAIHRIDLTDQSARDAAQQILGLLDKTDK